MKTKRHCYYIPDDGSSYVKGKGYRVAIVTEGEPGYMLTGTWPYTGAVGETLPYFWGDDLDKAKTIAKKQNARLGHSEKDVIEILLSSIGAKMQTKLEIDVRTLAQELGIELDDLSTMCGCLLALPAVLKRLHKCKSQE